MMAIDINDLTFDNIGIWPAAAKIVVVILLSAAILGIGYWLDVKPQLRRLHTAEEQEIDLRTTYEIKHDQSANLEIYKRQVLEMERLFADMLQQLPGSTEVPNLVEDISKMGVASGLQFTLIKPEPEVNKDFYAELPIRISVTGNYHDLASFISSVAGLQRIVTLDDFTIKRPKEKNAAASSKDEDLIMDLTAKTYRYIDDKGGE